MAATIARSLVGPLMLALSLPGHASGQSENSQILAHYKQAEAAMKSGDSQTASQEFKKILELDPGNAEASANLGVIEYRQQDFRRAKELFADALKRNPSLTDAKAFLGLIELRTGNAEEGDALLKEAFPKIRNTAVKIDAGVALIHYHQERKTLRQIVDVIKDLQESNPDNSEVLYVAYRAYTDLASEALDTLSKTAPSSAHVQQILGEAAMTQDDFTGAIAHFRKAAESDPKLPGIHYELGRAILTNAQDAAARAAAQREFETELSADPSDFNSEYELGETFRLGSDSSSAQLHFERALQLSPGLVSAHVGLGQVLMKEGKAAEAIPHLAEAVRLDPDNESAHYMLAREYRAVGRTQDADREFLEVQRLQSRPAGPP